MARQAPPMRLYGETQNPWRRSLQLRFYYSVPFVESGVTRREPVTVTG